jgi:thymidylate synthase
MRYGIGELLWYLSANNKLSQIQKYTKGWDRMTDDGETVNSNYGYCIAKKYGFDQLEFVINELKKNPNSRRAVIHIKEPSDKPSKDVNCTVCLQFFIREGKLYMTTYMRSNDIWFGFPYDVFQFTCLQIYLSMVLEVELGTYTHIVGSLHLYERNKK